MKARASALSLLPGDGTDGLPHVLNEGRFNACDFRARIDSVSNSVKIVDFHASLPGAIVQIANLLSPRSTVAGKTRRLHSRIGW